MAIYNIVASPVGEAVVPPMKWIIFKSICGATDEVVVEDMYSIGNNLIRLGDEACD